MQTQGTNDNDSSTNIDTQRMTVVAQMPGAVSTLSHIDELFQWLTSTTVERFDVQLIQFWANQGNCMSQPAVQLRCMACQDLTIPEQVIVNEEIALTARRLAHGRGMYNSQAVEDQFSEYRAALLKRYGLHYYASCWVKADGFLPPEKSAHQTKPAAPFALTILLFLRQPPRLNLMSSIEDIMNQAITIAEHHGLLLSAANASHSLTPPPPWEGDQRPPSVSAATKR